MKPGDEGLLSIARESRDRSNQSQRSERFVRVRRPLLDTGQRHERKGVRIPHLPALATEQSEFFETAGRDLATGGGLPDTAGSRDSFESRFAAEATPLLQRDQDARQLGERVRQPKCIGHETPRDDEAPGRPLAQGQRNSHAGAQARVNVDTGLFRGFVEKRPPKTISTIHAKAQNERHGFPKCLFRYGLC